ncbi:MAG: serine hydrolase [Bacteroidota bacterium]
MYTASPCRAWQGTQQTSSPDIQQLDRYFDKAQKAWEVPGLSVAIVKDGKVVLSKGYGQLESGKATAPDGNTLYAIASNTKAFIAASLAMLVEEGKVSWDDPVLKHLPYFRMYDDYVTQNITVEDLLCHRSGLGTFGGDVVWYKSEYNPEEVIRHIGSMDAVFPFRAGYGYSNLMFITAGEVIRAVSGMSWAEFVEKKIFQSLQMTRSLTSVQGLSQTTNVATPHKLAEGTHSPIAWTNWDNMGAAGGIISSVNDMAKWMQLQIDRGTFEGQSIFSEKMQDKFWTPHNNFTLSRDSEYYPSRNFSGYGLGWGIADKKGRKVVSHGGGYDGMYSRVVIVPEEKLGVVVLTNGMRGISSALTNYVLDAYLQDGQRDWSADMLEIQGAREERRKELLANWHKNRQADLPPTVEAQKLCGEYFDPMFGSIEIKQQGEMLLLEFPKAPKLNAQLTHWQSNTYQINWNETHAWFDFGTLQFLLDNKGKPKRLQFDVPNGDIFFHEIEAVRKR